jgi:hypothetical protein
MDLRRNKQELDNLAQEFIENCKTDFERCSEILHILVFNKYVPNQEFWNAYKSSTDPVIEENPNQNN